MKKYLICFLFATIAAGILAADDRTEPIDVMLALDKSLSMEEEIQAVKEYVDGYIIDQLLIPGDFFLVVAFYGETKVPIAMTIDGPEDKEKARQAIDDLLADGRFTDIGNALDVLQKEVEKYGHPGRRKYLLLMTDGIQEAPPDSKYWSPDGTFNHAFLQNAKVIQKKGWKIHILGIGTEQTAKELAQELSGEYTEVPQGATEEQMIEQTRNLLSTLDLTGPVEMRPVGLGGRSRLQLSVESKGYSEPKNIRIRQVMLAVPDHEPMQILPEPAEITVSPQSVEPVAFPVRVQGFSPGDYEGSLQFMFDGEGFIPVVTTVQFHVKSFFASAWPFLLVGLLVLVALVILLARLISALSRPRLRFRLVVQGEQQEPQTLREGQAMFLEESEGTVGVSVNRSPQSIARLALVQNGIRMSLLKLEKFPKMTEVPRNILDMEFRVRLEGKKDLTVQLARVT